MGKDFLIAMGVSNALAAKWGKPFLTACDKYGITSNLHVAHFAAQVLHESQMLNHLRENLNYKTPSRLVAVWPTRFTLSPKGKKLFAGDYTGNPEKLANEVYANRMGNGDVSSGDGWKFSGIGAIMLTGREMWQAYADYSGNNIVENPDLMLKPAISADAAAWFFAVNKRLLDDAERDDIDTITMRVNGGRVGIADRRALLKKAMRYLESKPVETDNTELVRQEPVAPPVDYPLPDLELDDYVFVDLAENKDVENEPHQKAIQPVDYPQPERIKARVNHALAERAPWWSRAANSKINWVQVVGGIAPLLLIFNIEMSAEQQAVAAAAIGLGVQGITLILRTFFNNPERTT